MGNIFNSIKLFFCNYITLSNVADIIGILSGVISFILWLKFNRFKTEIENQRTEFKKLQKEILANLKLIEKSIYTDNITNSNILSRFRQTLYRIMKKFARMFSKEDKKYLKYLIKTFEKDEQNINFLKIRPNIDKLIVSFSERDYGNGK